MATLIEPYRILSGIIFISGRPGGSEEIKHLKLGWHDLAISSKYPSNPLRPINQLCIRWTFYNITQFPSALASNNAFLAFNSYPYPMEIFMNLPFAIEIP